MDFSVFIVGGRSPGDFWRNFPEDCLDCSASDMKIVTLPVFGHAVIQVYICVYTCTYTLMCRASLDKQLPTVEGYYVLLVWITIQIVQYMYMYIIMLTSIYTIVHVYTNRKQLHDCIVICSTEALHTKGKTVTPNAILYYR